MKIKIFIFGLFCWAGLHNSILAQQDSLQLDSKSKKEVKDEPYGVLDIFDGNPGKSALYSLIIPGAGQINNKRYWKAPIVWAVEGTAIAIMIRNINAFKKSNAIWECMVVNGPKISGGSYVTADEYKFIRDNNRQQMEFSYLVVAIIHIINVADAFVDRHLIEFDVEDDISFDLAPSKYGSGIALQVKF